MKYRTEEEGWMCHVVPVDCPSVCFSFGEGTKRYEAIITKLNQSRSNSPNYAAMASRFSLCSTDAASQVSQVS